MKRSRNACTTSRNCADQFQNAQSHCTGLYRRLGRDDYESKKKRVFDITDSRICHTLPSFYNLPIHSRNFADGNGTHRNSAAGNPFLETSFVTREPLDRRVLVAPFPVRSTVLPNSASYLMNIRPVHPYSRGQVLAMPKDDEVRPLAESVLF
uniref:AlNc14C33G3023 protein n=1 Tax=Albugo laibachii Nc14 TaxID=890382 RepID=F0W846_9STRA|nr:AlNc14C33G3023 [Albugo laibachii Nc14]|eukprot:CCA17329.1 AlNc14C33G3023 [Albugo laibachii Nc14]